MYLCFCFTSAPIHAHTSCGIEAFDSLAYDFGESDGSEEGHIDSDDENDEDNWRNDYPEEDDGKALRR